MIIIFLPLKTRTAVVTATAENGVSASVEVIVRDGNYADGINKNYYGNICLKAGESTAIPYSLYSYKDGNDYSDETVSWSMEESTEGSFTLNNGTITALKNNESAVVNITITNGESASFNVYSADPIEQIVFDQNQEYRLPLNTRFNLIEEGYIHTLPEGSEIRGLNYSSDTPTVIYVNTNGNLRANTAGIANITVSSAENPEISVTQRFEVYDPDSLPAPTEINRDSNIPSQLSVGYSYINAAVKYNEGASDKTIWTSSDPETISVENTESPSCHLNVLKAGGPVQITATSALNPELSVTFEFTVTDEPVPEDLYELSFRIQQNDDSYLINPDRYTVQLDDGFCLWLYVESDVCVPDVFAGSVRDQMSPFMKFAKGGAGDYSYEKDHIRVGTGYLGTIINTGEYPVTFGNRTILINAIDSDEIILNSAKTEIDPDETLKIYASPDENIEWSTSDEYVATVDENGIVTGIGGGTAVITAKAGDKESSIEIIVTGDPAVRPLEAELITDDEIYATEPTVLKATATGGSAPYKYQFTAKIDGKWTTLHNGTESEYTCAFEKAGSYPVNVTVTDSTGTRVKSQKTLRVLEP